MSDWNFIAALGFDIQLLAAGACGGYVRSIFDKQRMVESAQSMVASAIFGNFVAGPAAMFMSNLEVMGTKVTIHPGFAAFFVGAFAFTLYGLVAAKLRSKSEGP